MTDRHFCPVCATHVPEFKPGGHSDRPGVKCPRCKANARGRLAWLFFERKTNLLDGRPKSMLHIAPEYALARRLPSVLGLDYISGDLTPGRAMHVIDITDIRQPDARYDCIVCSHVLEHVPDDRQAMRELARVLKPDGWALFMVPMKLVRTIEDPSITDPAERDRLFGHPEHVRRYGLDIADRLSESGFKCNRIAIDDLATSAEAETMGLVDEPHRGGLYGNGAFHCTRRQ